MHAAYVLRTIQKQWMLRNFMPFTISSPCICVCFICFANKMVYKEENNMCRYVRLRRRDLVQCTVCTHKWCAKSVQAATWLYSNRKHTKKNITRKNSKSIFMHTHNFHFSFSMNYEKCVHFTIFHFIYIKNIISL